MTTILKISGPYQSGKTTALISTVCAFSRFSATRKRSILYYSPEYDPQESTARMLLIGLDAKKVIVTGPNQDGHPLGHIIDLLLGEEITILAIDAIDLVARAEAVGVDYVLADLAARYSGLDRIMYTCHEGVSERDGPKQ